MTYIKRSIENIVLKSSKIFPAILISGARQVGKTTLIKQLESSLPYLTLDDPILLQNAINEPGSFFKNTPPPLIVDEIQYAPNLFPYIKMIADSTGRKGLFYLSGSQQFQMMKKVSESLAGRIGILILLGLSLREINNDSFNEFFIPSEGYFSSRKKSIVNNTYQEIWKIIHQGSMPALYANPGDWNLFYSSYLRTYIERDVRELTQIGDEQKFLKFMMVIAGRTGQMLNLSSIAGDIGISVPTVERWLSILITSNLVYLLQPYYNNTTKRAIKTPKLYFLDTGLAAYLTKWNNPEVLEAGAMAGAFFETFVIGEVIKSYYNAGVFDPPLYYYRDKDKVEVDLIIEENQILHPLEIKKTSNPDKDQIKGFTALRKINGVRCGNGGIICMYDKVIKLDDHNFTIPVNYL